ncbi:uncharacterized protein LOC131944545 [Physella acuta]|uniref:uncharacterized protein LOC131944545 n=1 Tax=Physella acuta TaxID=109671 RepID=UPI0027DC02D5|nr:uncharacterized protein LOC131944545 [Physella acuta]
MENLLDFNHDHVLDERDYEKMYFNMDGNDDGKVNAEEFQSFFTEFLIGASVLDRFKLVDDKTTQQHDKTTDKPATIHIQTTPSKKATTTTKKATTTTKKPTTKMPTTTKRKLNG